MISRMVVAGLFLIAASLFFPAAALAASAQPVGGKWGTHPQGEGPVLTFADGSLLFVHARCRADGVELTTMLPADGGYEAARRWVGRWTGITFTIGALRLSYSGNVHDDGEMIAVSMPASLDDPLFAAIASGSRMTLASSAGAALDIPLAGSGKAVATWMGMCGAKPAGGVAASEPIPAAAVGDGTLPAPVREWVDQTTNDCREQGGRPKAAPDYIRSADFNGDGKPDYLIDDNRFECKGGRMLNCGSHGCVFEVYLSGKNGYRRVGVNMNAYETTIETIGGRPTVVAAGKDASVRFQWNGRAFVRR